MISKTHTKYIQSLQHKKFRDEADLFIAEGPKVVLDLLAGRKFICKELFAVKIWIAEQCKLLASLNDTAVVEVEDFELKKISALTTSHQVLAVFEKRKQNFDIRCSNKITLALDAIQDPGNLGTIIRIADWFGIKQIIAGMDTVELYNPKVIQSSMGSFLRVNLWYQSLAELLENPGVSVYGALLHGSNIHNETSIAEGILVIGNESKGLSEGLLPFINHPVTIPRIGGAESLNAAVATVIILSHLKKG